MNIENPLINKLDLGEITLSRKVAVVSSEFSITQINSIFKYLFPSYFNSLEYLSLNNEFNNIPIGRNTSIKNYKYVLFTWKKSLEFIKYLINNELSDEICIDIIVNDLGISIEKRIESKRVFYKAFINAFKKTSKKEGFMMFEKNGQIYMISQNKPNKIIHCIHSFPNLFGNAVRGIYSPY